MDAEEIAVFALKLALSAVRIAFLTAKNWPREG